MCMSKVADKKTVEQFFGAERVNHIHLSCSYLLLLYCCLNAFYE